MHGDNWRLQQCHSDSQAWNLIREVRAPTLSRNTKDAAEVDHSGGEALEATEEVYGLIFVYVDDFLLLMPRGGPRDALKQHLQSIWEMTCSEDLSPSSPLAFLGLQLEKDSTNDDLTTHQRTFVRLSLIHI